MDFAKIASLKSMPTYLAKNFRENRRLEEFSADVCGLFLQRERGLKPIEAEDRMICWWIHNGWNISDEVEAPQSQRWNEARNKSDSALLTRMHRNLPATDAWRTQGRHRPEENVYVIGLAGPSGQHC